MAIHPILVAWPFLFYLQKTCSPLVEEVVVVLLEGSLRVIGFTERFESKSRSHRLVLTLKSPEIFREIVSLLVVNISRPQIFF